MFMLRCAMSPVEIDYAITFIFYIFNLTLLLVVALRISEDHE